MAASALRISHTAMLTASGSGDMPRPRQGTWRARRAGAGGGAAGAPPGAGGGWPCTLLAAARRVAVAVFGQGMHATGAAPPPAAMHRHQPTRQPCHTTSHANPRAACVCVCVPRVQAAPHLGVAHVVHHERVGVIVLVAVGQVQHHAHHASLQPPAGGPRGGMGMQEGGQWVKWSGSSHTAELPSAYGLTRMPRKASAA